ncbi:MAG: DUF2309 domain-containing protein [Verrucomicrobia bacterium]|nr:DUF2309 domain-containing protein [Verrucomicrobiota bacterium]
MKKSKFNESEVLHELKHYLPAQSTLKDFVHHNSLHSFQDKEFFDGIFSASKIFGFHVTFNINNYRKLHLQGRIRKEIIEQVIVRSKGRGKVDEFLDKMLNADLKHLYNPRVGNLRKEWKKQYKIGLDNLIQPLLFRILGSFLDQGIALWHFPFETEGLIEAIRILEKNSYTSFFRSKRAKQLLFADDLSIEKLLGIVVGNPDYYKNYLFDQQFSHKGWSGIVAVIEENPDSIFYKKNVKFQDLILLELLLEIDALDKTLGKNWKPLAVDFTEVPTDYLSPVEHGELEKILQLWQEAFEWDYYDDVLSGVAYSAKNSIASNQSLSSFQAVFCVDDRECSYRRHLESADPQCVTYGAPGFFGAAIYFQPFGGKFYDKNCPVALTPTHLIKEVESNHVRKYEVFHNNKTHSFFRGVAAVFSIGLLAGFKMTLDLASPKMQADISNAFAHMDVNGKLLIENQNPEEIENGVQVGYQVHEMADVVEPILKGIGLIQDFAPIVYIVAHGSSSANNPHHGAHDCGACSGRPGAVNARVYAFMANHKEVRKILAERNLIIPETTRFIAAMHDTASDEVAYYDEDLLSDSHNKKHTLNKCIFEKALDNNAKERGRRFSSININKDLKNIRKQVKQRSVSYFEPRPELGHGTNALCHIGSRDKIKGLFLDRRAFLQSYDCSNDPEGEILAQVLGPLPGVCGGINLEYYFSRMDIEKMGAGTKLPHNVTGLIGVTNSSDGDIRTGLPLQMIENHDPVRLLMMIEHRPEIILEIIKSSSSIYDWFDKGWIHLVAISPEDGNLYLFRNGNFEKYTPLKEVLLTDDINRVIKERPEMKTNHILDATEENIPTYVYSK